MKPYVVEYTFSSVVMAEDQDDAASTAFDTFREAAGDSKPVVDVHYVVTSILDALPTGWDMDCLPYGGDGSTRLKQIVTELQEVQ